MLEYSSATIFTAIAIAGTSLLYLWHLQPWVEIIEMSTQTIPESLFTLCNSPDSVSSEYAKNSKISPGTHCKRLFDTRRPIALGAKKPPISTTIPDSKELERAYNCGKFSKSTNPPSELFLRIFHAALLPLASYPMLGTISPSMMGSIGTIPLTIIGSMFDVVRHMSNLIVRAKKEVIIATNFWKNGRASQLLSGAIRELSRRAGAENNGREKVIVKVMLDRGHLWQLLDNHTIVSEREFTGQSIGLPHKSEIPNVDLEVMNYHRLILGTFHSKLMIVDRKIALIQSNNIQDNDNLEMATQVEGPIVDSFYDMSLITWDKVTDPPYPLRNISAIDTKYSTFDDESFRNLFDDNKQVKPFKAGNPPHLPKHTSETPHYDDDIASEVHRSQSGFTAETPSVSKSLSIVAEHLNETTNLDLKATAPPAEPHNPFTPYNPSPPHSMFPIAMVNRAPWGAPNHSCVAVPQNEAWLAAIRGATRNVFIQTPDCNSAYLLDEIELALVRGVNVEIFVCMGYNDAGEVMPAQGGTNEMNASKFVKKILAKRGKEVRNRLKWCYYVGKDQNKPIHNSFKKRSCHIKLMIVDEHIGIQGSGNQDAQSWYHSQEANILFDSPEICKIWSEGIKRNQNTQYYGVGSAEDGIWRDADGKEADGATSLSTGPVAWVKGAMGMLKKAQGK